MCAIMLGTQTPEFLKLLSLVLLTLQNAALILVMRYVRTREGDMFFATSAVVVSETLKLFTSLAIILHQVRSVLHFSCERNFVYTNYCYTPHTVGIAASTTFFFPTLITAHETLVHHLTCTDHIHVSAQIKITDGCGIAVVFGIVAGRYKYLTQCFNCGSFSSSFFI